MGSNFLKAAGGVAVVLCVFVLGSVGYEHGPWSSEMASWVQGLGSVAAVGVACWFGVLPMWRENQMRAEGRLIFLSALRYAALGAVSDVARTTIAIGQGADAAKELTRLRDRSPGAALERLLTEPPSAWPSHVLYVDVSQICGFIDHIAAMQAPGPNATPAERAHFAEDLAKQKKMIDGNHEELMDVSSDLARRIERSLPRQN